MPAHAQTAQNTNSSQTSRGTTESDDDYHTDIIVKAPGLSELNLLAGRSVVSGIELQRNLDGQVGNVLAKLPGVSTSSFAPGVSRPVLRGLQGDRVRIMVDGIGLSDASGVSADHGVSTDPLTAQSIDVVRGPAVLLYGSSAIGGAVNIHDKRIPRSVPDEPVHIDALAGLDSASDLREGGASLDVPVSKEIAFHVDGSYRKTDDIDIPGYVLASGLRQDALDAADAIEGSDPDKAAELRETANQHGTLPNSDTRTYSLGTGLAWVGENGSLGASFGYYNTRYGTPDRPSVDIGGEGEEEEEGPVQIHMRQYRGDLRGSLNLASGPFSEVHTRWGYSDYSHTEFANGEPGTTFNVKNLEGRLELVQQQVGDWTGSLGGQFVHRDFEAIGDEAFVPPSTTDEYALFTLQEINRGPAQFQGGLRYSHTDIDVDTLNTSKSYDNISASLGASYEIADSLRLGINGSRASRSPNAEELFANGPHEATEQFEIGSQDLSKETAWGLEGYLRGEVGPATVNFSIYKNWFKNYVYLQGSDDIEDNLPVYYYLQQDADYFGLEGEVTVPLYTTESGMRFLTDLRGDYIRATLDDGSAVPLIPPLSLLGALEMKSPRWGARAEVQWFDDQNRTADYETPTDGYTFVNLSVSWKPMRGNNNVTLMLQGNNIFDVEGRMHTSATKDFAPLRGRNVKLSLRMSI
ncbi:TonB-dependent receptor [Altericroceibacterium spongiae]|uniref:TonB-dependent receptor n=1 Tax=Altericroceibacterium spongiae TaxID=2320269 RepID=UPI00160434A7|nr:TonB-dependent receptor [Altericroceibacterium spongiae]